MLRWIGIGTVLGVCTIVGAVHLWSTENINSQLAVPASSIEQVQFEPAETRPSSQWLEVGVGSIDIEAQIFLCGGLKSVDFLRCATIEFEKAKKDGFRDYVSLSSLMYSIRKRTDSTPRLEMLVREIGYSARGAALRQNNIHLLDISYQYLGIYDKIDDDILMNDLGHVESIDHQDLFFVSYRNLRDKSKASQVADLQAVAVSVIEQYRELRVQNDITVVKQSDPLDILSQVESIRREVATENFEYSRDAILDVARKSLTDVARKELEDAFNEVLQ